MINLELPDINYTSRIADWIELYLLVNRSISKNKVTSLFQRSSGGDVEEAKIDSAFNELERRLDLYGNLKPYSLLNNVASARFNWKKFPTHTLCLFFSAYGAADGKGGTKLFERLTESCLNYHLGSQSVIFGFPAKYTFTQQVDIFASKCLEKREDDPAPFDKDRGVDIIAWKAFGDKRKGRFYFLVQCAAGGMWRDKKSIPITSWRRFVAWNSDTTIPAIAVTQIVEAEKWQNALDDYGVIIDRARLYRVVTSSSFRLNARLKHSINEWCIKMIGL